MLGSGVNKFMLEKREVGRILLISYDFERKNLVSDEIAILVGYKFTDPKIKESATRFVERYRSLRLPKLKS